MIQRADLQELIRRVKEPRKTIQVIVGPRQIGKTTLVKQMLQTISIPYRFYSANDNPVSAAWISDLWESARQGMTILFYKSDATLNLGVER